MKKIASNRGLALLTALVVMVMVVAIVLVIGRMGRLNLNTTVNQRAIQNARLATESGLNYIKYHIRECKMVDCDNGNEAIVGLKQYFTSIGLAYTAPTSTSIKVSSIAIPGADGYFEATISSLDSEVPAPDPETDPVLKLAVTGHSQETIRTVELNFKLALGSRSPIFDFGFSTGGVLKLNGSSIIEGYNESEEGNVYMSNEVDSEVIILLGQSSLSGKVFAVHDDAYVTAGANCSVNDAYGSDIVDNVYQGIDKYPLPEVDTSPFVNAVSSWTTVDGTTDTTDATLSNITIAAGTNPTFTGSTNISGVIYIESPNKVTFNGDINITGVIVTETGNDVGSDCLINFSGGVTMVGPEYLPDLPEYETLKTLTGTALLAKGFKVTFSGTNTGVGGTMAASSFAFNGNGDLHVKGSVICYKDGEMTTLVGNQTLKIDQSDMPETPPGFVGGQLTVLAPVAETYVSTPEGHF